MIIIILIIILVLVMLKLLPLINETAVENSSLSNEVIQKMPKSFAKSLAKRLFIAKY